MIGLIAVRSEAGALLKSINIETTTTHIQARFHRGRLAGRPVILAEVGPGKAQTAAVTQHLIDRYEVELMISCGSAGALVSWLQAGDVILAETIALHDAGLHFKGGFHHLGLYDHAHPDGLHYRRRLAADPALLAAAHQTALNLAWPDRSPQIKIGGLVSGDQVIADDLKKQWLRDTFNALAVEMEAGAMAQIAFLNDVPWLAVRAVSDNADSTLDFGFLNFITYTDEANKVMARLRQTARQATVIAQKPGRLKAALKFRQALQYAAANAARVTAAIITQLA